MKDLSETLTSVSEQTEELSVLSSTKNNITTAAAQESRSKGPPKHGIRVFFDVSSKRSGRKADFASENSSERGDWSEEGRNDNGAQKGEERGNDGSHTGSQEAQDSSLVVFAGDSAEEKTKAKTDEQGESQDYLDDSDPEEKEEHGGEDRTKDDVKSTDDTTLPPPSKKEQIASADHLEGRMRSCLTSLLTFFYSL